MRPETEGSASVLLKALKEIKDRAEAWDSQTSDSARSGLRRVWQLAQEAITQSEAQ